ncbi:MAG: hypothetical protein P1U53_13695 [Sulfitobacter sp.]|nr:hypothetical protein [Sulfitobacter sp.]
MKLKICALVLTALALAACDMPAAGPSEQGDIRTIRVTSASAIGIPPIPRSGVAEKARAACPGGYDELSRRTDAQRRISGVIYVNLIVEIRCR